MIAKYLTYIVLRTRITCHSTTYIDHIFVRNKQRHGYQDIHILGGILFNINKLKQIFVQSFPWVYIGKYERQNLDNIRIEEEHQEEKLLE